MDVGLNVAVKLNVSAFLQQKVDLFYGRGVMIAPSREPDFEAALSLAIIEINLIQPDFEHGSLRLSCGELTRRKLASGVQIRQPAFHTRVHFRRIE